MISYKEIDAAKIEMASLILKAIAHPVRLAILGYLSEGQSYTVTEIHQDLNLEQSTASHHLGILKDKGVLSCRRDGKMRYYTIKNMNLAKLVECINTCTCIDEE